MNKWTSEVIVIVELSIHLHMIVLILMSAAYSDISFFFSLLERASSYLAFLCLRDFHRNPFEGGTYVKRLSKVLWSISIQYANFLDKESAK